MKNKIMRGLMIAVVAVVLGTPAFAESNYRMKIASVGSETHPSTLALNEVKKYVESKTANKLEVSLYPNSALGGDRQISEGMQLGTIEAGIVGTTILAAFNPKFNVFDLPFLFKNKEAAYKSIDGEIGVTLNNAIKSQGLRIIGYGVNGYRHITNNRGPIYKPEDLKGLKIRCMENPIHVATFKLMGANPTPMSFSELYTALAQKTVDAEENPINLVFSSKFYEVQKYYSLTGHLFAVVPLVVSEKWFQGLPKDMQAVVLQAGKLYQTRERAINESQEKSMLDKMIKAGLKVNDLTPSQKEAFIKVTLPIYDQFKDKIGNDMIELAKKANK
jgi:tripartite ATP-independent transporter DctP family solute receptor